MRKLLLALALSLCAPTIGWAVPQAGQTLPSFSVEDLASTVHTQRDLTGRWTVILAMTDKDTGPAVTAWYSRIEPAVPAGGRMLTFAALSLFPLIPSSTIFSEARGATPRNRWAEVWLSRNGSLRNALGLTESETPWIFVVDPSGHVVEGIHAYANAADLARITAALNRARPQPPLQGASASR